MQRKKIFLHVSDRHIKKEILEGLEKTGIPICDMNESVINCHNDILIMEGTYSIYKPHRKIIYSKFKHENIFIIDRDIFHFVNSHEKGVRITRKWNVPFNRHVLTLSKRSYPVDIQDITKPSLKKKELFGIVLQPPCTASVLPMFDMKENCSEEVCSAYINLIREYGKQFEKIVIKLHPGHVNVQNQILKRITSQITTNYIISRVPLRNFISECDLVAGISSLSLIEAFFYGKPIITLSRNSWSYPLNSDILETKNLEYIKEWLNICRKNCYKLSDLANSETWTELFDNRNYGDISAFGIDV